MSSLFDTFWYHVKGRSENLKYVTPIAPMPIWRSGGSVGSSLRHPSMLNNKRAR
jgi:hypothetical protein